MMRILISNRKGEEEKENLNSSFRVKLKDSVE